WRAGLAIVQWYCNVSYLALWAAHCNLSSFGITSTQTGTLKSTNFIVCGCWPLGEHHLLSSKGWHKPDLLE
ncbi:MAG: hypothetical protein ACKPKO_41210, partial [Candidatus Fonsibacter sp.]